MQLIQAARENIRSLLEQCNVAYEITPFDDGLYQDCIDDAVRRGYPVDGRHSIRTFLREGVVYAATAGAHLTDSPTRIWIALFTSCAVFVDDTSDRFPDEMPNISRFNDRFVRKERQGSGVLDAFADIILRASDLYRPIASHLIITSTMNFVTATVLENETKSMEISSEAEQYPIYQRTMSGVGEAYGFMVFPRELPVNDYIQAIPEIARLIDSINDVLSFYKEELLGDTTNQISTLAARARKSKLETFNDVTETTIGRYKRIVKILERAPEACEAFKKYAGGYVRFHTSTARYMIKELDL